MSSEQVEYVCPQCRRRTVVNARSGEEDSVFCPRCEIDMKPYVKTSDAVAAAANAPVATGGSAATKTKAKATKTRKTASADAPAKPAKKGTRTSIKAAAEAIVVAQPDFGEFRCQCCGYTKSVALGTEKPAGGWRCPSCFVKLAWLKS